MDDARAINNIKGAGAQAGIAKVGLDESHPVELKAPDGRGAELQRRACHVGGDDDAIGACQIQRHLSRAAPDVGDRRVAGNGAIEQPGKRASPGARAERLQAVAPRIAWKRRPLVKPPHGLGAAVHQKIA